MFLFIIIIVVLLAYFIIDRPIGNTHIVKTRFDELIPLVPEFSVPYLLFLPILIGTILYAYISNSEFKQLAESIIVVYLLCYAFFIIYQTHVPRPKLVNRDIYTNLVRWIYKHDKPYNCLPSTHSSGATILAVYYLTSSSLGWIAVILSLLIVLSTLFVKQHYVPDAVSGVILGLTVSLLLFK